MGEVSGRWQGSKACCGFSDFSNMQKALEEKSKVVSAQLEWIPSTTVGCRKGKAEEVMKLVAKLEQDEDVQQVSQPGIK
jgi:transcriptional/translational regulatory protein YebC/TACO1